MKFHHIFGDPECIASLGICLNHLKMDCVLLMILPHLPKVCDAVLEKGIFATVAQ